MSSFQHVFDRCDDLLNPIIVKELRQVVRGRFFWGVLILFLIFQCLVLSFSIAEKGMTSRHVGAEALEFLFGILFFASYVLIPVFNGMKFAKEQTEGTDELLFITTITPEKIIMGKFAAGMVFILLIFSAFSPFMFMTFFLSGVDLSMTLLALLAGLLFSSIGAMVQICCAALSQDTHSQQFFRGAGIFLQVTTYFSLMGMGSEIMRYGGVRFAGFVGGPGLYSSILIMSLFLIYFLFKAAAAVIQPTGADRMRPVRLTVTGGWLLTLVIAIYWAFEFSSARFIILWGGTVCAALVVMTMVTVSERDSISERVARDLPAGPTGRRLAFILSSGAAGGMAWVALMTAFTVLVVNVFAGTTKVLYRGDLNEASIAMLTFMSFTLGYGLFAVFIRRAFFSSLVETRNNWVVMLLVFVGFSVLPMLLGVFVGSNSDLIMMGNPFVASAKLAEGVLVGIGVLFAGLLTNFLWLKRQVREFLTAGQSER